MHLSYHSKPRKRRALAYVRPEWLTIDSAVAAFALSRSEIYEGLRDGRFEARKDGMRTLINAESLRRYILSLPLYPAKPSAAAPEAA